MATTVTDNPAESRYEIHVDGRLAGYAAYYLDQQLAAFIHTQIESEFGGQGLATTLIRAAMDDARARGWAVEPFCPFVRAFLTKNHDYRDLVPAAERIRFGLE